ncbi:MAG: hypothetical protein KatS3mg110_2501 [Pirellulaceae bacterium]|nr:MAG: hypothetical protein KatS3mg110_2501 [Pirellulaceae bacterium]
MAHQLNGQWIHEWDVRLGRRDGIARRDLLRWVALGTSAIGLRLGHVVSAHAQEMRKNGKHLILLWMQGGPSQFETFTPKPGHANGGETRAIPTRIPGVPISENLPQVAGVLDRLCLLRSVTAREGTHSRATYLLHTGYLPTATVKHPTLGASVAHQLAPSDLDLPAFVRIGQSNRDLGGGGLLGVKFDPFVVSNPGQMPQNATPSSGEQRLRRRLALLEEADHEFAERVGGRLVEDRHAIYRAATDMILSPKMQVFELDREPVSVRQAYGDSTFARGCLLARRLVEAGVTCVEVTLGNWDTHEDNFNRSRSLCGQLDQPMAALVRDLEQRGLLESTLVVWMGEFGRTPRINPRGGRDHYPRAFSVVLGGCGVRPGQAIGQTDAGGVEITGQPVTVPDLFRTIFTALGIDPDHENMSSIGRPIKLVDGGQLIQGVL